jgi:pyruvate-formate lyase
MSVQPGDLSDTRDALADQLEGQLTDDQRDQLRRAIPDDVLQGYREAGEETDEQEALAQAAANGIDQEYINYYDQRSSLREALSSAAQSAFDQEARDKISALAKEVDLDDVYAACSRGNFSEAADIANLDNSNFDSANECKNAAANATDYSKRLFNGYRENDSGESFTPRGLDE